MEKVNQVLKNCGIKSRSVNHFGAEKSHDLDTILPHGLGWFFHVEKLPSVNQHIGLTNIPEFPISPLQS